MYNNLDRKYPQVYAILTSGMDKRKAKRWLRKVYEAAKWNVGWAFEIKGYDCGLVNDKGFITEYTSCEVQ